MSRYKESRSEEEAEHEAAEELGVFDEDEPKAAFHRERREHGGAASRLNEDQLDELTEEERVEAGLDPYDPDEVPPATDDSE
jgi:hypothetical protein